MPVASPKLRSDTCAVSPHSMGPDDSNFFKVGRGPSTSMGAVRALFTVQRIQVVCLLCSKCHENVKAVQRAWQEEFHNQNWSEKRTAVHTIDCEVCSRVLDGFQNCLTAVLAKEGDHFELLYQ
ncbi:hypothetical protein AVEN_131073-1 [Araneus ventricosus]|uniref:DUF4817 domain-containing protein n=1 Tax=Araneus ventricosus TaxID=182803 RepID=A0A4Y2D2Z0_ARAVE|nr:hypothetical protein AVEN_131073-1 [Araneus ventricosus]